ncbi:MAG: hypothetical protein ACOYBD_09720 [Bilifractor sp.]
MDGKTEAKIPSEMRMGSLDGNCLEKLPSGYNFRQMDGNSRGENTIGNRNGQFGW